MSVNAREGASPSRHVCIVEKGGMGREGEDHNAWREFARVLRGLVRVSSVRAAVLFAAPLPSHSFLLLPSVKAAFHYRGQWCRLKILMLVGCCRQKASGFVLGNL